MRAFAALYEALDQTNSTNSKVAALASYFRHTEACDAAWGLFFLTGQRLKRLLSPRLLAAWACERAQVPEWMFSECYAVAGDLAETASLLIDTARGGAWKPLAAAPGLADLVEQVLLPLQGASEDEKRARVLALFEQLDRRELFLFFKLCTGELRVGVSATLAVRALAEHAGLDAQVIAHRLMGKWQPSAESYRALLAPEAGADLSRPYPFFLASPLEEPPESLGDRAAWLAEWKWDGIRAQLVRRAGSSFLWSRGEELIGDRFPDLAFSALPDGTVLDGEVLAYADGAPLPFSILQTRIGRQKLSPAVLAKAPAAFMAYDLLEERGEDLRALPLLLRRERLARIVRDTTVLLSPSIDAPSWEALRALRETARERHVEGVMLKRLDSPYRAGRPRGEWWKWKIAPRSIDAVLVYAQPGNGRRATVLSDMTFALWRHAELVPVAKAYSGLTDAELDELDKWIRANTLERFGPVRAVKPELVFELHFEGIARSARHKSGVAVRFPRIARFRSDKKPADADQLETLLAMIQ